MFYVICNPPAGSAWVLSLTGYPTDAKAREAIAWQATGGEVARWYEVTRYDAKARVFRGVDSGAELKPARGPYTAEAWEEFCGSLGYGVSAPRFALADLGDSCAIEVDGFTITAKVERDPDMGPPWEEHGGHGPVSDWRRGCAGDRPHKRPGERELTRDGGSARFYDFAEAVKIARRDDWGAEGIPEGATPGQRAALAAEADFARLKAWCVDEWCWVGVVLEVERAGVTLAGASLWGIESDAGDYLAETAEELLDEALDAARAKLAELAA